MKHLTLVSGTFAALLVLALQGCGLGSSSVAPPEPGTTTRICLDPSITDETARQKAAQDAALIAFFDAHEGDTVEFCEGQFNFTSGLTMSGKRGITIKGAGKGKTYLRFKDSPDQDGFNLNRLTGITVQGLTIYDAPGNGLRVFRCDNVLIRDVKVGWSVSDPGNDASPNPYGNYEAPDATGTPPASWSTNGSYAFYPVLSHQVLIEDSISVGSSDAGVYVGQSSDILVRRTEAYHNVAGFEFENTYRAEFVDNVAHDNVGGFLVFDLPGRAQFGEKNLVHDNRSYDNNVVSFAPRGAIVGDVPSGTGMLVLASDQLEVYRNTITNNKTVGLAIVNYGLVDTAEGDRKYDFFPEGLHIYDNAFEDNGGNPQPPDNSRNGCSGNPSAPAGIPSTNDLNNPACTSNNASLLVTIIQAKNNGNSAQIVWDGAQDKPDTFCVDPPTDHEGVALTQAHAGETGRYEARFDERGRPNYYIYDYAPACAADSQHHTYNAWKFDGNGALKKPANGMCVEGNTFTRGPANQADDFVNVHFATADPTAPENQTPGDHVQPSDCPSVPAPLLTQYIPRINAYTPNPANDPRPSLAELASVCNAVQPGKVNGSALASYNCPRLDQYGLFSNAADPTTGPNGGGVLFDLNTALFSDYAVKYRFLFLPEGQKATYVDIANCHDHGVIQIFGCNTATLDFPVGTVFAKTFAFRKDSVDKVVETRLLIKRQTASGAINWVGMAYLWNDHCTATGARCAELKIEGATQDESYDYDDPDPAVGAHYSSGSEPVHYVIPNAGNCLLCHGGDDRDPGAAPIGPKVRNLNKNHDYGGATGVKNQLTRFEELGLLDLPGTVEAPMPKWNVPGSSGQPADSAEDKHRRVRSYLEVNCMHCHNPGGAAQNSGLSLDALDAIDLSSDTKMDEGHGICKPPIAAGKAADNAFYDIVPTDSGGSLLFQRISSTEPGIKMPPLARSVVQTEAMNLVGNWINTVVDTYAYSDTCKPATGAGTAPAVGAAPLMMTAPN